MLGGILVVAVGSGAYWLTGGRYVSIDDAYVRAAKETLSTDVSGIVADVPVHEGQHVKKGACCCGSTRRSSRSCWNPRKARCGAKTFDLNALKVDYQRMLRDVAVKEAQVQADQANFDRFSNLVKSGGVTRADYDNAHYLLIADQGAVSALKERAQVQLANSWRRSERRCAHDARLSRTPCKGCDEAQRQLDHSVIYAPFDGIVTQVDTVQKGMYLAASTAAFGIVSTDDVWVEANPKETELTYVKDGDPVDVVVDTYPEPHLEGCGGEHRAELGLGVLGSAGAEHIR